MNPICMGERMQGSFNRGYFVNLPQLGERVHVDLCDYWRWQINNILNDTVVSHGFVKGGKQAAANAATKWLLERAEKTRILASRRAA